MANIKEEAKAYEPPQTLNIAELEKVPVEIELHTGVGKDKEGKEFKYKYIVFEGREYRVPLAVLGQLKAILKKIPDLKQFSVLKEGSGMGTRYQVLPLGN